MTGKPSSPFTSFGVSRLADCLDSLDSSLSPEAAEEFAFLNSRTAILLYTREKSFP